MANKYEKNENKPNISWLKNMKHPNQPNMKKKKQGGLRGTEEKCFYM